MLTEFFDAYARDYRPYKGGRWCYEDGCVYRGLELLHRTTGDRRWRDHLIRLVDDRLEDGPALAGYDRNEYNIDNIQAGRALIYLDEITGDRRDLEASGLLIDQLETHPRTGSGVYWHKLRYPWQIRLDGLYMAPPFQIGYGLATGNEALASDALTQVGTALDATHVPATGLYAHAFDEAKKQRWADPVTGWSRAHWARALGWLAMALVDIAELAGPDRFAPLGARTTKLLADIARLRRPDGLWLQVIDAPDLKGNYGETSASAMFVYALLKARDLGLWTGPADRLTEALVAASVREKAGGGWEMVGICEVAGLGMFEDRYRDGSAEYYISEPRVADDAEGVGPLMMAVATDIARAGAGSVALAGQ